MVQRSRCNFGSLNSYRDSDDPVSLEALSGQKNSRKITSFEDGTVTQEIAHTDVPWTVWMCLNKLARKDNAKLLLKLQIIMPHLVLDNLSMILVSAHFQVRQRYTLQEGVLKSVLRVNRLVMGYRAAA